MMITFSWVTAGTTERIISVSLKESQYKAGETANVRVTYGGPPDWYWNTNQSSDASLGEKIIGIMKYVGNLEKILGVGTLN
ncbi:MAG: hypothetical protein COU81_02510 [Candidatus Portnoybacteria bacterium CG10_big_fil_rev_8_21_14_0_10_36_7]|uniref:Uncharacterized protein n=1 Tax=Candidatus Portnoybacteria bacterium CG10_big_fil_rev_8_21_14_0_10_36_7 TaxID=1974812 RepID=A0A2M8KDW4_9BACT|nr:MAG: hypothetical protein COU81_02510 [Candidatus Portnoybacteria bacterium CG10_big_fil_rev_8_21_14_0_10_36_7]